jgi:hypothetical protein
MRQELGDASELVAGARPPKEQTPRRPAGRYSTVTDLARFLGWSTSVPISTAVW